MTTLCFATWREARDESSEPRARAVRQAQIRERRLDRARSDVHDAAEAARDHAVDHGSDQHDRRNHVVVDRFHPRRLVPVAEVADRRTAGVVDQDIRVRTRGEHRGAAFCGGDVGGYRHHRDTGLAPDRIGGRLERRRGPRIDDQIDAFPRQRGRGSGPWLAAQTIAFLPSIP